jgi:uncharacterized protein (DUF433 family)
MTSTSAELLRVREAWIQKTPDVCGGDACIRNTRIPVWSLVVAQRLGVSDADLQQHFVTPLSAADIEAAFAYFEKHPEEIEEDIRLNHEA